MTSQSKDELARELEAAKRALHMEKEKREMERHDAEIKASIRESRASTHTAQIVFFGGIALAFLLLLFQ